MSTKAKSTNESLRQQVKDINATISQKRDERAEAIKARDEAKAAFVESGQDPTTATESPEFKTAEEAVAAVGELDDAIGDLQATERGILRMLGSDEGSQPSAGNGPMDALRSTARRFDVAGLLAAEPFQRFIQDGGPTSRGKVGELVLGQIGDAKATAHLLSGGMSPMAAVVDQEDMVGAQASDRRGIITPNLRPLRLLDLISTGTTNASVVEYVQVLTTPEAAEEWVEGEPKPEASFTTQDADAPVRTIAVWIKVRRSALSDVGMLEALLRTLLVHDVRRRTEDQMVAGDGIAPNLLGLLNVTGIGEPLPVVGDNTADAILRAITTIFLSDGDPNFVALHPLTWQELLLMRENQAERTGAYLYGSPSMQIAPTIWGLAITNNRAVTPNEPIVGDSSAATLLVREGLTVRMSDSDQDDFIRNRVTILVEVRVAFPVWRPTSFAIAPVPEIDEGS